VGRFGIYVDEDAMDTDLVAALRYRGVAVTTPIELELTGTPDEVQLRTAAEHGLVFYTFNVSDFYSLHTKCLEQGQPHAGMILCRQQRFSVGEQLRRILHIRASRSAEDMRGRVEFLGNWD
jgi:hypothetical protein